MSVGIKERLIEIRESLPSSVKLIAVSKTQPVEALQVAYDAGQRIFGENKAQELKTKNEILPKDIEWHFIGHLQTNKIKYISSFVSLIHSIDSLHLLKEVNRQAEKHGRVIDCLLQFHVAEEETKFGLDRDEAVEMLRSQEFGELKNVRICGVMGMATFTDDEVQVRREFGMLKAIFDWLKDEYFVNHAEFAEISMGMSGDYPIAIEEGATYVRVGSSIFGERDYL